MEETSQQKHFREVRVVQGTPEWFESRCGIITASTFNDLITKTGRISTKWEASVNRCVAERLLGGADEGFQTDAMIRGQSLEQEALDFFNITSDYNFESAGLLRAVKNGEDLDYGASPDGMDYENNVGIEIKCPLSHTHVGYLLNDRLPDEYKHQVQGAMLVTGFKKWVFGSYHPDLKCLYVEVERDEKYIETLKKQLDVCSIEINKRFKIMEENELSK